jgi:hypothetical protein
MFYYITTPEIASEISHIKAVQEGCTGITQFWWEVIYHPIENLAAIVFSDFECELEGQTERILYQDSLNNLAFTVTTNDVVTYSYMIENGWFNYT